MYTTLLLPNFQAHRLSKGPLVVPQPSLRTKRTNRLNAENKRGVRNVPLPNNRATICVRVYLRR